MNNSFELKGSQGTGHIIEDLRQVQDEPEVLADMDIDGYVPTDTKEKHQSRALNRKFDIFVLPICVLIYLLNGLDRSNLGNAATAGFTNDLGIPADTINTASSLFFCTVSRAIYQLALPCFFTLGANNDSLYHSNRYLPQSANELDKQSGCHSSVHVGAS